MILLIWFLALFLGIGMVVMSDMINRTRLSTMPNSKLIEVARVDGSFGWGGLLTLGLLQFPGFLGRGVEGEGVSAGCEVHCR